MARLIQLIETEDRRGRGTEDSPVRMVRQYFTPDGELVAENDAWLWQELRDAAERNQHDKVLHLLRLPKGI